MVVAFGEIVRFWYLRTASYFKVHSPGGSEESHVTFIGVHIVVGKGEKLGNPTDDLIFAFPYLYMYCKPSMPETKIPVSGRLLLSASVFNPFPLSRVLLDKLVIA
jgi:hypothetical protein